MYRKILIAMLAGSLLIAGFGCSKKETAKNNTNNQAQQQNQLPAGHPNVDGSNGGTGGQSSAPAKPIDGDEVAAKISKALDAKYPGEWSVSGTNLQKGSYTENNNYKIVEEVANLYPGSMVSMFIGEKRISSNIKGQDGKPILEGYPTPAEVGKTMTSGKILVANAGSMGASSYQKVYLPLKAGDKTVGVMTISIAQ